MDAASSVGFSGSFPVRLLFEAVSKVCLVWGFFFALRSNASWVGAVHPDRTHEWCMTASLLLWEWGLCLPGRVAVTHSEQPIAGLAWRSWWNSAAILMMSVCVWCWAFNNGFAVDWPGLRMCSNTTSSRAGKQQESCGREKTCFWSRLNLCEICFFITHFKSCLFSPSPYLLSLDHLPSDVVSLMTEPVNRPQLQMFNIATLKALAGLRFTLVGIGMG